jgi:hypothetical protein
MERGTQFELRAVRRVRRWLLVLLVPPKIGQIDLGTNGPVHGQVVSAIIQLQNHRLLFFVEAELRWYPFFAISAARSGVSELVYEVRYVRRNRDSVENAVTSFLTVWQRTVE